MSEPEMSGGWPIEFVSQNKRQATLLLLSEAERQLTAADAHIKCAERLHRRICGLVKYHMKK